MIRSTFLSLYTKMTTVGTIVVQNPNQTFLVTSQNISNWRCASSMSACVDRQTLVEFEQSASWLQVEAE